MHKLCGLTQKLKPRKNSVQIVQNSCSTLQMNAYSNRCLIIESTDEMISQNRTFSYEKWIKIIKNEPNSPLIISFLVFVKAIYYISMYNCTHKEASFISESFSTVLYLFRTIIPCLIKTIQTIH